MFRKIPTGKAYKYAILTLLPCSVVVFLVMGILYARWSDSVELLRYEHDLFAVFMNRPAEARFFSQTKASGRALQQIVKNREPQRMVQALDILLKLEEKVVDKSRENPPSNNRTELARELYGAMVLSSSQNELTEASLGISRLEYSDDLLTLNREIEGKENLSSEFVWSRFSNFLRAVDGHRNRKHQIYLKLQTKITPNRGFYFTARLPANWSSHHLAIAKSWRRDSFPPKFCVLWDSASPLASSSLGSG